MSLCCSIRITRSVLSLFHVADSNVPNGRSPSTLTRETSPMSCSSMLGDAPTPHSTDPLPMLGPRSLPGNPCWLLLCLQLVVAVAFPPVSFQSACFSTEMEQRRLPTQHDEYAQIQTCYEPLRFRSQPMWTCTGCPRWPMRRRWFQWASKASQKDGRTLYST